MRHSWPKPPYPIGASTTCASPLLARGVSLRAIQEVLGHSSCMLTANIYAHVLPELHRDVAARMDDILTG